MCGAPRPGLAPATAPGAKTKRFWPAFLLGFAIALIWAFEAASAWSKSAGSARATFDTDLGIVLLLIPVLLLVATIVPGVPERFRTPAARRVATGLLVGLLAPFVTGFGVVVGILGSCIGTPF
jgi:hypothetical protein